MTTHNIIINQKKYSTFSGYYLTKNIAKKYTTFIIPFLVLSCIALTTALLPQTKIYILEDRNQEMLTLF